MRTKVILTAIFLLAMAAVPICVFGLSAVSGFEPPVEAAAETEETAADAKSEKSTEEKICGLLAAVYKEEYCAEALKAFAVLLRTDYTAAPEKFDLSDKSVCVFEEDAEGAVKDGYAEIKAAVEEVKDKTLRQNGEALFVPYSYVSNGSTVKSGDYPFLTSAASPWDCFSVGYEEDAECAGVSMYGVNYLCENGFNYESALKWYLPELECR